MTVTTLNNFNHLPYELTAKILCDNGLSLIAFGNCQKVCKLFNQMVNKAEMIWEKWAHVLDPNNLWRPIYICKSLRSDFTWKWLVIDFKTTEKQTLKSIFDKYNYTTKLKQSLEKTQYSELTPFLHSDNPETLNLLGESFLWGKGCPNDLKKAVEYFKRAAHQKHAGAQYNLGMCYENGLGCPQNAAKAFRYYGWAAKKDHADAQNKLGEYYITGKFCKQNTVKAFCYYKLAADQGHADAKIKLDDHKKRLANGSHYYELAVKQCGSNLDLRKRQIKVLGAKLYDSLHDVYKEELDKMVATNPCYLSFDCFKSEVEKIANKHYWYSNRLYLNIERRIEIQTLTWLFAKANHPILKNTLVHTQYHELAPLYRESPYYSSNSPELSTLMGEAFLEGKGCPIDSKKAFRCFEQASKYLYAGAQYYLGVCYENGRGCPQDNTKALRYYEWAAKKGHANAQFRVACYSIESDYPKNLDKAFPFFKLAADQGLVRAQVCLGICYERGIGGCLQDCAQAFHHYELAAEQGYEGAQCYLGVYYEHGLGCQQNLRKAFHCYKWAAEQGKVAAQYKLGYCYQTGSGCEKNLDKALEYYALAESQEIPESNFNPLFCYEIIDCQSDRHVFKAFECYKQATNQKMAHAHFYLGRCYEIGKYECQQSLSKAFEYYTLAADQGLVAAIEKIKEILTLARKNRPAMMIPIKE